MRRTFATLALVFALVFAGCSGSGGSGTPSQTTDSPDSPDATVEGSTGTPVSLADEHPYRTAGSVNATAMTVAHLQHLQTLDSYTLGNNVTVEYAANGSVAESVTRVDRVDFEDEELARLIRQRGADGEVRRRTVQYRNATHDCSVLNGSLSCGEGEFRERRVISTAIETTTLETVLAPAFEPDGTVTRSGQGLYRYTATTLRDNLTERTRAQLGTNPDLSEATVLVHPSGRVVEYEITYTSGSDGQRRRGTFIYTTGAVNATSVPSASSLVSE